MGTWILTSGRAKAGNMFILTWKSEVALSPKSTEVRVQVELARTVPAEDHKWSCLLITPTILFILNITRHGEYLQFRDHGYFYSYWKIRKNGQSKMEGKPSKRETEKTKGEEEGRNVKQSHLKISSPRAWVQRNLSSLPCSWLGQCLGWPNYLGLTTY